MADQKSVISASFTRFIMIFLVILTVMMIFNAELRNDFGALLGYLMEPLVGLNRKFPVLTLLLAGLLMTLFSTTVRHYFVNWVEAARIQKIQSAYNKEKMDAIRKGNMNKMKKLKEKELEIQQLSIKMMGPQLKTMAFTMFVIIAVFTWLYVFIKSLPDQTVSVPWASNVELLESHVLPHWILLYSLVSIPLGQLLQRLFKHYTFKRRYQALIKSGAGA